MRDFVGSYAHCNKWGDLLEDLPSHYHYAGAHPLYELGNMQLKWNEYNHGILSLWPLFAALTLLYKDEIELLTQHTTQIIERIHEHINTIHHALLGDNDIIAMDHD